MILVYSIVEFCNNGSYADIQVISFLPLTSSIAISEGDYEVIRSPPRQQNRRGRTVMKDVHALHPDDLLIVTFNERGQPYGDLQPVLANYVGPRSDARLLRQPALEGLTRSTWMDSPRKVGRNDFPAKRAAAAAHTAAAYEKRGGATLFSARESRIQYLCDPQWFRDTASRGPTTIVAPESQFRTCPSDHDSIGYPRMSASGESSTTMHQLLHASGSHPIPTPYDPKCVGAGATPSQVLPDQCRRSSFYRPSDNSAADVTENLRAMEEKMKKDMEARESNGGHKWRRKRHNFR
ncbi:hypothetical protein F511_30925 [Dorcoceras hygrometricum]|uniref:Uncharacterized protein n=1 Tax=Dorcoceras hygrometricum TaxID=472368 RepID=A0A2Z7CTP4_9LAMI|nr:hypothetical protein F511_30925 [Dorcoceras hygrometricum]